MPNAAILAAKAETVEQLSRRLRESRAVIMLEFRGLTGAESTALRADLRRQGVEFRVIKNTLTRRAAAAAGLDGLEPLLEGPNAYVFSGETDPVMAAKLVNDFLRTHKSLAIKGGVLEGRIIDAASVQRLATLPSREQLLAQVAAGFAAPLRSMASVLAAPLRGFATQLHGLLDQRQAAA
ncbi:MAG: 50S ribosomal protein L10 [Bacillota bacterium]|nr:50S ribosomal protein L10 [Bacillota bacterium]